LSQTVQQHEERNRDADTKLSHAHQELDTLKRTLNDTVAKSAESHMEIRRQISRFDKLTAYAASASGVDIRDGADAFDIVDRMRDQIQALAGERERIEKELEAQRKILERSPSFRLRRLARRLLGAG
jgi:hypothetical protein